MFWQIFLKLNINPGILKEGWYWSYGLKSENEFTRWKRKTESAGCQAEGMFSLCWFWTREFHKGLRTMLMGLQKTSFRKKKWLNHSSQWSWLDQTLCRLFQPDEIHRDKLNLNICTGKEDKATETLGILDSNSAESSRCYGYPPRIRYHSDPRTSEETVLHTLHSSDHLEACV